MKYLKQEPPRKRFFCLLVLSSVLVVAAHAATVRGTVADSLGAVIPNARVELILIAHQRLVASAAADGVGRYEFHNVSAGRYQVQASAPSFDLTASKPFYVGEDANANVDMLLAIGVVSQAVTVTATGTPTPWRTCHGWDRPNRSVARTE